MPELPEVEVSRLGITPYLEGQCIERIEVRQPKLRWPIPTDVQLAVGETVKGVRRRAKYLLLDTDKGSLVIHLGMSGALRVRPIAEPLKKHDHVVLHLSSGLSLRLNDPRRFGAVLWQMPGQVLEQFTKLGPEPLQDTFGGDHLHQCAQGRRTAVKAFIMDNHVVVGVGNIYATEALFNAGIDPRRQAGRISRARYMLLASAIEDVLRRAIAQGGTSLKDFTQADGKPGYFKQQLHVYGRAGQPCVTCQNELKSVLIGQRNSAYCPQCQR